MKRKPVVASPAKKAADWPQCHHVMPRWKYFKAGREAFDAAYLAQLRHYGVPVIAEHFHRIARLEVCLAHSWMAGELPGGNNVVKERIA